jgi:ATPases of the AAA+ class
MDFDNKNFSWAKYLPCSDLSREEHLDNEVISRAMIFDSVLNNYCVIQGSRSGKWTLAQKELQEKIDKINKETPGFKLYQNKTGNFNLYAYDRGVLQVFYPIRRPFDEGSVTWTSGDPKLTKAFKKLHLLLKREQPEGRIYVLVPCSGGITKTSIGLGSCPLTRENYRPEVIKDYDKIVKDLQTRDPLGRLVIFSGPTGTGKTYLIKALMDSLPGIMFLILPSNMTATLSGPEILSALIQASDESACDCPSCNNSGGEDDETLTKPSYAPPTTDKQSPHRRRTIALVIEDADSCLSSRATDNISAISSVLNLSDGIIGNCLDLRIIATTNQESKHIDKALLRTGRLSAHVEVNLLDVGQAQEIYRRLEGKPRMFGDRFYSLSDVYAMAKDENPEETQEKKTNKRTIGFGK